MKSKLLIVSLWLLPATLSHLHSASTVQFASATFEANELDGWGYFTVVCAPRPTSENVKVTVRVGLLTASRADFSSPEVLRDQTVTVPVGEGRSYGYIHDIADDGLPEADETLSLTITSAEGPALLGARTNATFIIRNAPPTFEIDPFVIDSWPATEGPYAREGRPFAFTIFRRGDTNATVSVDYATTTNHTAIPGVDFIPSSGRLEFLPGERSKGVVPLLDNGEVAAPLAPSKRIEITLSNPSTNAAIRGYPGAQVEIEDNEIPPTLDLTFAPDFRRWPGVGVVAVQSDGKILISGLLFVNGKQVALARLNADGSFDESFHSDFATGGSFVSTVDGKFLVQNGGPNGTLLVRLLNDGSTDLTFHASEEFLASLPGDVRVTPLRNRQVLLWGTFVKRLNEDGSEDKNFNLVLPQIALNKVVEAPDGTLLISDIWSVAQGLFRFHANGPPDLSFTPPRAVGGTFLQLADGKLIAQSFDGTGRLVRLEPNGTLDPSFASPQFSDYPILPIVELDGYIYCTRPGDEASLVRLDTAGHLDLSFSAKFTGLSRYQGTVLSAVPHKGALLCWSLLSWANGSPRPLARIIPAGNRGFMFKRQEHLAWQFAFAAPESAREQDGTFSITIQRTGETTHPAAVYYRTRDGTARAGRHYVATEGKLEFQSLQVEATIKIQLIKDSDYGGRVTFFIELENPSPTASLDAPLEVEILDQDLGLAFGNQFRRLDGVTEIEYVDTGLRPGDFFTLESSSDLLNWKRQDRLRSGLPRGLRSALRNTRDLVTSAERAKFFRLNVE